ncbi:MAG: Xaa-Pro peptidase family protein [Spirochaetes bacterium]|nr:Xaa-Pro peptidase family protein [Spirochaetota bacterium]
MRIITKDNFNKIIDYLDKNNLDGLLISDSERKRDVSLKYISGHPMDASLIITKNGKTYLWCWDIILAKKEAEVDYIYTMDQISIYELLKKISYEENLSNSPIFEVSSETSVFHIDNLKKYTGFNFIYKEKDSVFDLINRIRMVKSEKEIKIIKEAASITNDLIEKIYAFIKEKVAKKEGLTENDLAFYVIKEARKLGAQKESFEYLIANSKRSWGIHAYPPSSNEDLTLRGLALIDFGILYNGYCTDVTIPFSFGDLSEEEKNVVKVVQKAHDEAIKAIKPGKLSSEISDIAISIIKENGYTMPHSLGHGIGLEVHEYPRINSKPTDENLAKLWKPEVLEKGMIFTIEPGIYEERFGGCRLEDDVLVTDDGYEILTKSKYMEF